MDEAGTVQPLGYAEEIVLQGHGVFAGYAGDPEGTAAAFVDGWFRTGDAGYFDTEGYLFLTGRLKEVINRGGEKIAPREVDEVLLEHPAVAQALTFALPHATLGEDVAVVVVLRPHTMATEGQLRVHVAERLAPYKVPRRVVFLAELPLGPTGKPTRTGLAAKLGLTVAGSIEVQAQEAATAIEQTLGALWAQVLEQHVEIDADFLHLGGDSLQAMQLLARVRTIYGVELPVLSLFDTASTVAKMAMVIEKHGQDVESSRRQGEESMKTVRASLAQESIWVLAQVDSRYASLSCSRFLHCQGLLDVGVLERSLGEIARRHDSLRTTLHMVEGQVLQIIAPHRELTLPMIDLRPQPAESMDQATRRWIQDETTRPFDLERGPLAKFLLARQGPNSHVLMLSLHHSIADAWSLEVLSAELSAVYAAFAEGRTSPLPALTAQYGDFATWQREQLQEERMTQLRAYWTAQLAGVPTLALALAGPVPAAQQETMAAQQSARLSATLTTDLRALSRRNGVTPFMTMLAAFAIVLQRQSGQEDIAVGVPMTYRPWAEWEKLIGYFINTLVLRLDMGGNPSFKTLLGRVRQTALAGYAHQDLPFEQLVAMLNPDRNSVHTPLVNVRLNYINTPQSTLTLPRVTVQDVECDALDARYPLTLYVDEELEQPRLRLVFQPAYFSEERIAALLRQYMSLLAQVITDPEREIGAYTLVTTADQALLPDPRKPIDAPCYVTLPEMVEQWSVQAPDLPAVRQGARTWTYSALYDTARTLARTLMAQGCTRGDVVAACGPRSYGMVAGMLGVLLCGGVLLPVDPRLPVSRRRMMLEIGNARHVLLVAEQSEATKEDAWWPAELTRITVDADTGHAIIPREPSTIDEWSTHDPGPCRAQTMPPTSSLPQERPGDPRACWGATRASAIF